MARKPSRPSAIFDRYRAEALRGVYHRDLADKDREWIWRSLLKGVRRKEAVKLARLKPEQVPAALKRVHGWYQARIAAYKREQARQAKLPQVVRPVVPVAASARRGWWPFGKRG